MLKELYEDVEDVDYYVGGLLERRKAPLFGPTFQALLEDQFWRWRYADRFFFNFVGFPHSFTKGRTLHTMTIYLTYFSKSFFFFHGVNDEEFLPENHTKEIRNTFMSLRV